MSASANILWNMVAILPLAHSHISFLSPAAWNINAAFFFDKDAKGHTTEMEELWAKRGLGSWAVRGAEPSY